MLIHAMVISLLLLVFTGTILTQAVVASKVALQASVARYLEAAAGDGVADLTAGMQYYVKYAGSAGPWQAGSGESRSPRRPVCAETVAPDECPFTYDIAAHVTGSTTASPATGAGTDVALNLQSAVIDEQRVSAQVTVHLYPRQSDKAIGSRTRYLTYRVFNSAPYAIISGVRDGTSDNGLATSAQGDTSGTPAKPVLGPGLADAHTPRTDAPDAYRDSRLQIQMVCSTINDPSQPQASPGNEGTMWGVSAPGIELPCHLLASYNANAFIERSAWKNGNAQLTGWDE
jgi:hypothetical protein